jgi:hypothetical protein
MLVLSTTAKGQSEEAGETSPDRILVTITDPGSARINHTGRPGPGYRRRAPYFASVVAESAARHIAEDFRLERLDDWSIRPLNVFCVVFAIPRGGGVERLLEQLRARPDVESAQRLNEFETLGNRKESGQDPYAGLQYVIDTLELSMAHTWSMGAGVDVAIIDTGADFNHPDLRTQIAVHRSFVAEKEQHFADDSHGTAVAGVIAAASGNGFGIVGVAPAARLSVLEACWYAGNGAAAVCNSFTLAKALTWAIEKEADVINLSLAGPPDALLSRLALEAQQRGAIVIGAAPDSQTIGFPANVPGVLVADSAKCVTGVRPDDIPVVYAPGDDILVATPHGGFDYSSGSSLAAAHVSGVVALLMAIDPKLRASEINSLISRSQPIGGDSINACRAVAALVGATGCRDLQSSAL